jgi:hypothetical protein
MTENNHNKSCGLGFTHDFGRIPFFNTYFLPFLLLGLLQLCVLLSFLPISTCSKTLLFPIAMTHHEFSIMKVYFVFVVEDLFVVHTLVLLLPPIFCLHIVAIIVGDNYQL